MTWRQILSVVVFLGGSSLTLACEAVSHANDYATAGAVQACGEGTLFCNGACVAEDGKNCGACGSTCEATQVCSAGTCGSSCTGGTTQCGSSCVDLQNDPKNCGQCGGFADAGACNVCVEGHCQASCGSLSQCGSTCVDFATDPLNCGGCAGAGGKRCVLRQVCAGGDCKDPCVGSLAACPSGCVDIENDPNNCGKCAGICPTPSNGVAVCSAEKCGVSCPLNYTVCLQALGSGTGSGTLACINVRSNDANNCGGCNVLCRAGGVGANGGTKLGVCVEGVCT
ncbi:MAG: hypothetical protein ABI551_06015 [Polyangiaceae bacterium]